MKLFSMLFAYLLGMVAPLFASDSSESSSDPVTTHVTDAKSPQLLTEYIRKEIVTLRPNNTPVDQLFRMMDNSFTTKSWISKFYTSDIREFTGTVNGLVSASSGLIAAGTAFDVTVTNSFWIIPGDVIMFKGISGGDADGAAADTKSDFIAIAYSKTGNDVSFIAVNGYDAVNNSTYANPAIADATELIRIGNAHTEIAAQVTPFTVFPQPDNNYAQRFMKQVEESLFDLDASKEVSWNINDFRMHALFDLRMENEYTLLFGKKGKRLLPSGEYVYTMDGVIPKISKTHELPAVPDDDDLNSLAKYIFAGNNGAPRRFWFIGSDQLLTLSQVPTYQKQIEANGTETVLGVTFTKIVTNYGELMIKYTSMLDYAGWGDKGVILDMTKLVKGVRKPLTVSELELRKSGQRNVKALLIDETWTNFLLGADQYHSIVTTAAA